MNFGEWELRIEKIYWNPYASNRLYLFQRNRDTTVFLKGDSTQVVVRGEGVSKDKELHFADVPDEVLQALVDGITKAGVKTQSDFKNEGLLEATKYHLEDMRSLALGKKK